MERMIEVSMAVRSYVVNVHISTVPADHFQWQVLSAIGFTEETTKFQK